MKKLITPLLIALFFCSCKKEDTFIVGQQGVDEVTYEVTLINASTWHGVFINENAQVVAVEDATGTWKYTFKNSQQLIVLNLTGYADGLAAGADVYLKIYINGSLVASSYSSSSPQAQYVYP